MNIRHVFRLALTGNGAFMKNILRILLSPIAFGRFIFIVLLTIVLLPSLITEDLLAGKNGKYRFIIVQLWARLILFGLGIVVVYNNMPKTGSYILMPNHRSYFDIFLMGAISPSAFILPISLFPS